MSAQYATTTDSRPSLTVETFRYGLELSHDPAVLAEAFVTPEFVPDWGDFSQALSIFETALTIDPTARYRPDAPDVVYVALIKTNRRPTPDTPASLITAHVTLVWRPEIAAVSGSRWRVHHIGEPITPENAPRSAPHLGPSPSN